MMLRCLAPTGRSQSGVQGCFVLLQPVRQGNRLWIPYLKPRHLEYWSGAAAKKAPPKIQASFIDLWPI